MADFGFGNLSDTDESAVDELISQTKDLCVLEQVSKINCSSFNDSLLPSDLETRFRKLKSFPVSGTRPVAAGAPKPRSLSISKSEPHHPGETNGSVPNEVVGSPSDDGRVKPEHDNKSKSKRGGYASSSPSDSSSNSCIEDDVIFSQSEAKTEIKRKGSSNLSSKSRSKPFVGSPLGLSNASRDHSPSPPKQPGCFWCSPKKTARRKSKENWDLDWGSSYGGDELLSDLGTFSVKEQQRILNTALKEEEKINREADKIVRWAKQASSRMMSYRGNEDDDDVLSDDDDDHVTGK